MTSFQRALLRHGGRTTVQTAWVAFGALAVLALYAEVQDLRSPMLFIGGAVVCCVMIAIGIVMQAAAEPSVQSRDD